MKWIKDGIEYDLFNDGTAFVMDIDKNLTDVKIPSRVNQHTVIGIFAHACQYSKSLLRLTIPATVQEIGVNAFADCDMLDTVIINAPLIILRYGAFMEDTRLRVIVADKIMSEKAVFAGCSNLKRINATFGGKIKQDLFADCTALEQVMFSSGAEILEKSFTGCSNLKVLEFFEDATIHPEVIAEINHATIKCHKKSRKLMDLAYEGLKVIV